MVSLISISLSKACILSSTRSNHSSPSTHQNSNPKPPVRRTNTSTKLSSTKLQQPRPPLPQPSVAEIERAIGAGIFRDRDIHREPTEQSKTLFDSILSNSIGETEGPGEKRLRETGEWIIDRAEGTSTSAGKTILRAMFLWILPIWIVSFLVASGTIKLPFSIPLLDDLIM